MNCFFNSNSIVTFHQSSHETGYGKLAKKRGLKRNLVLFSLLDIDGAPKRLGMLSLSRLVDKNDSSFQPSSYSQRLAFNGTMTCYDSQRAGCKYFE